MAPLLRSWLVAGLVLGLGACAAPPGAVAADAGGGADGGELGPRLHINCWTKDQAYEPLLPGGEALLEAAFQGGFHIRLLLEPEPLGFCEPGVCSLEFQLSFDGLEGVGHEDIYQINVPNRLNEQGEEEFHLFVLKDRSRDLDLPNDVPPGTQGTLQIRLFQPPNVWPSEPTPFVLRYDDAIAPASE